MLMNDAEINAMLMILIALVPAVLILVLLYCQIPEEPKNQIGGE
jgi:hypothetical protein